MKKDLLKTHIPSLHQLQYQTHRLGLQSVARAKALPQSAWMIGAGVVLLTGLNSPDAMADLPTALDNIVPAGVEGSDGLTTGARLMQLLFQIIAAGLGLLAVVVPVAAMIKSYRNRKQNDNDDFHGTVLGGLFLMVLGLGFAITGFQYSGGLADQVMQLQVAGAG